MPIDFTDHTPTQFTCSDLHSLQDNLQNIHRILLMVEQFASASAYESVPDSHSAKTFTGLYNIMHFVNQSLLNDIDTLDTLTHTND